MVGKDAIGKYRLLRQIGSGGNASVYLASPLNYPNRRVVVKRIHDHIAAHPKFRQLFEAEVRSMANFSHPYTVRLIDWSSDDPIGPCLVMEYVAGMTLEAVLARQVEMPLARIGRLIGCICHALQSAHDAGIVHRDLKPANLMVMNAGLPTEVVKVMDFGFASFATKPHLQLAELTGKGPIYAIGTPSYVSPEMIRGDRVDSRSDLYSVGVILYEMVTGRLPFREDSQERLLGAHVHSEPPRFRDIGCRKVPEGVESVVQLALSKFPIERQQTAREIAVGFGNALGEKFWEATAPEGWEKPREKGIVYRTPPQGSAPKIERDPFTVVTSFEVAIPERLAAAKIRGFVDDYDGEVLASEPGVIIISLGVRDRTPNPASKRTGLLGWINTLRQEPQIAVKTVEPLDPIEVELRMEKPDISASRLRVSVSCRPSKEQPATRMCNWHEHCEKVQKLLRQYLGA